MNKLDELRSICRTNWKKCDTLDRVIRAYDRKGETLKARNFELRLKQLRANCDALQTVLDDRRLEVFGSESTTDSALILAKAFFQPADIWIDEARTELGVKEFI